jgi:flagellar motor switch/type III secretory pathway protein FliN
MSNIVQNITTNPVETSGIESAVAQQDLLDSVPWLPCTLTLDVPVVRFSVADLLALTEGTIVETSCHNTSDVPLRVNNLLIGWTEFEVVGDHLAVRITDLA